jgi:hypothetical protein
MAMDSTERANDVTATLPGKRTVRVRLVWREIVLHDGRKVQVCEHRPVAPASKTALASGSSV